jgi:hypothetical protein
MVYQHWKVGAGTESNRQHIIRVPYFQQLVMGGFLRRNKLLCPLDGGHTGVPVQIILLPAVLRI